MAIGSGFHGFDAFRRRAGGDDAREHLALNSPGGHRADGIWEARPVRDLDWRKHVEQSGASLAEPASTIKERNRVRDGIANSDVFGALAEDELERLMGQGRVATYAGGAVVFRKGDPAEDFMTVLYGRIRLSSTSRSGREVVFDFIGAGRCFGEMALHHGMPRKLDATAVKPSAVFTLRRRDALACFEAHPEIAVRAIGVLCARLSRAMEMFEDRTQLRLPTRSARILLRLASEYGDGKRIELKISQTEIAGLIGATREKVNRQLCAWCRCGILAVDEGRLTILDQRALRAISEEDLSP